MKTANIYDLDPQAVLYECRRLDEVGGWGSGIRGGVYHIHQSRLKIMPDLHMVDLNLQF